MKFTCDSCSAQYMISDEKVGPNGVKVRCKKCGNVVLVRRAEESADVPVVAPAAAPAEGASPGGLDVELGQAFDSAFGDPPAQSAPADASNGASAPESESTGEPAATAPAAASPAPTEWYVAIGQAQVGPLPLAEVKRKWEAGDVGPDSLVWRPGLADWAPLSSVAELADYLAPVPRAPSTVAHAEGSSSEPQGAREKPNTTPAPGADVTWKPIGASALAALANEEIATRTAPEAAKPASARASGGPSGVKSLMDGLPDGGGVDPTGAIPLSIKGLDSTGEKKIERRSSVASRAEETRHKRSMARAVVIGVVVVIAFVAGASYYVLTQMKKLATAPSATVAKVAPTPAAAPPAVQSPAAHAPAAPGSSGAAAAGPAAPQPVAAATPPSAAKPAAPPPAPAKVAPAAPPPPKETTRVARKEIPRHEVPVARAEPPPPPPPTRPQQQGKKKDSLLDFDSSGDAALDDALGGGGGRSSGRSVYVPPAPTGGALPNKLTPAQINESVAGRIDALRRCVSEQKARDPGASGILKLRWLIGGDGNVREVKTLSTEYASSPFAQCITGVVRTIKFPRSTTTGQEVTFPFSF